VIKSFLRLPFLRLLWLVLLFVFVQCKLDLDGGMNATSRWAALAGFAENGNPQIDAYVGHTIDWARPADGHYYSNKAPGPMLLALPLFLASDRATTQGLSTASARNSARLAARAEVLSTLSIVLQALPYALLVMSVMAVLVERRVRADGLRFACVALLFGNTAALFMNTFFGHGLAAVWVLALWLSLYREKPLWVGISLGFAVLCDYGAALLALPTFVWLWQTHPKRWRPLAWCALGGLGPLLAFALYHRYCFGGPFTLPNKFNNPAFIDVPTNEVNLWGVLRLVPPWRATKELLVGSERGLLWTQPWCLFGLFALAFVWWRQRHATCPNAQLFRRATLFAVTGFALVFWMNASFNGWNGGFTAGPRYLSIVFPPLALALGLGFAWLPSFLRQLLDLGLVAALLLWLLVFSVQVVLAPPEPIAHFYLRELVSKQPGEHLTRFVGLTLGLVFGWWQVGGRREAWA